MAQNLGSFGAPLTGMDALRASMQDQGMDASILDQVSGSAPGEQALPGGVPTTNPQAGFDERQAAGQAVQQPEQQFRSAEGAIAAKALKSVIDTDNAIAKQAIQFPG